MARLLLSENNCHVHKTQPTCRLNRASSRQNFTALYCQATLTACRPGTRYPTVMYTVNERPHSLPVTTVNIYQ